MYFNNRDLNIVGQLDGKWQKNKTVSHGEKACFVCLSLKFHSIQFSFRFVQHLQFIETRI